MNNQSKIQAALVPQQRNNVVDLPTINELSGDLMIQVITTGDCKGLTPTQKLQYYEARCREAGLSPVGAPFQFIIFKGKEVLYPKKEAAEQLRMKHHLNVEIIKSECEKGIAMAKCRVSRGDEYSEDVAYLALDPTDKEAMSVALMKVHTKAKRRAILSFCGLGDTREDQADGIRPMTSPQRNCIFGQLADLGIAGTEKAARLQKASDLLGYQVTSFSADGELDYEEAEKLKALLDAEIKETQRERAKLTRSTKVDMPAPDKPNPNAQMTHEQWEAIKARLMTLGWFEPGTTEKTVIDLVVEQANHLLGRIEQYKPITTPIQLTIRFADELINCLDLKIKAANEENPVFDAEPHTGTRR